MIRDAMITLSRHAHSTQETCAFLPHFVSANYLVKLLLVRGEMVNVLSVLGEYSLSLDSDLIGQVTEVEIEQILPADLVRLNGISEEHVNLIADSESCTPPIIVHKKTMQVIDGMHRLKAARLKGETHIEVRFFDGSVEAAFVLAVMANNAHGLPLTAADRRVAVGRLLELCPDWSNRAIAAVAGVSAHTVSSVRRSTGHIAQSNGRVGRDGRVRPASTAEARRKAAELMGAQPDVTLRQVAKETGLSLGTVADVRRRTQRGEDPVPAGRQADAANAERLPRSTVVATSRAASSVDVISSWRQLSRDPSLRYTKDGRQLLRLLSVHSVVAQIAQAVPKHCSQNVALLARECAQAWEQLAQRLEALEQSPSDSFG